MKYEIKITYYDNNKQIKEIVVYDYGVMQGIDEVRFKHDFKIMILSASFTDIDKVIDDIK